MSGIAGYKAQLKLGGVPTIFTDIALTQLKDLIFRITDPIKRVISADYPLVVEDNSNVIVPWERVNYLEGVFHIIDFASYDLPFKVTGRYIPLEYIGGSKEYSLEIAGDVLDATAFHDQSDLSAGYRQRVNGIHDISVSFSRWQNFSNAFIYAKQNQTPIFVSVNPGGSNLFAKGWFQIETDSLSGDIGSLEEESVSLVLCDNKAETSFSYAYNLTDGECALLEQADLLLNWFLIVE